MSRTFRAIALALVAPLFVAGCSLGSTTDAGNGFGIDLVLNPATPDALTAQVGGSATAQVVVTRVGTFTGDVTLAAEQVPSPVIVTFNPAVLTAGVTSSVMTMTLPASMATGTSAFRLHASAAPDLNTSIVVQVAFTN